MTPYRPRIGTMGSWPGGLPAIQLAHSKESICHEISRDYLNLLFSRLSKDAVFLQLFDGANRLKFMDQNWLWFLFIGIYVRAKAQT